MGAREVILRRRALFLGSALCSLSGCPREPATETPVVDVPAEGSAHAMPDPEGRVVKEAEPPDEHAQLPPLDVPADATGMPRQMFEQLAKTVPKLHERLRRIETTIPRDCDFDDTSCTERWDKLASELHSVDREIEGLMPLCPGSSEMAQRYLERVRLHYEFARKRREQIEERIARVLSPTGKQRWELMTRMGRIAIMRPCLSCIDW